MHTHPRVLESRKWIFATGALTGAALDKMTPIAVGSLVPPATRARVVESERTALERLWNLTTALDKHLADDDTAAHAAATDHLARGRTALLIAVGLDLLLVLGTA